MSQFLEKFTADIENYLQKFLDNSPLYFLALALFFVFWLFARLEKSLAQTTINKFKRHHQNIEGFLALERLVRIVILLLGLIFSLSLAGVDLVALAAGLGLVGFALGFALKDFLANFLAGIILLLQKSFKIGDLVEIEGKRGKVIEINIRTTILQTSDNEQVIIPNADLLTKMVIKW
jgi:small-conductance mechanosensitive channel